MTHLKFGIDTINSIPKPKAVNPCIDAYGRGPEGKRCKSCVHLRSYQSSRVYHKCAKRKITNGPATDHRVNWPACGMFEDSPKWNLK